MRTAPLLDGRVAGVTGYILFLALWSVISVRMVLDPNIQKLSLLARGIALMTWPFAMVLELIRQLFARAERA